MVGKVETEQKRQAWEASLDQLHHTIREIIQAQKNARYMLLSRLPNHYLKNMSGLYGQLLHFHSFLRPCNPCVVLVLF